MQYVTSILGSCSDSVNIINIKVFSLNSTLFEYIELFCRPSPNNETDNLSETKYFVFLNYYLFQGR